MGKDDVLDDYVLTSMVETVIELHSPLAQFNESSILDYTGLDEFINLEVFDAAGYFTYTNQTIDLSNLTKLKSFSVLCSTVDGLDFSNNIALESFHVLGGNDFCNGSIKNMDFSANTNLKNFVASWTSIEDFAGLLGTMPNLETCSLGTGGTADIIDLSKNPKLKTVTFFSETLNPENIDLRSGGNSNLQSINFSPLVPRAACFSVDDVAHVQSILTDTHGVVTVSLDCGL